MDPRWSFQLAERAYRARGFDRPLHIPQSIAGQTSSSIQCSSTHCQPGHYRTAIPTIDQQRSYRV
ncbi:hypothetical protein FOYG_17616 [Fusarium oxysporum NRRL 32931]|uniref:Uncharacterized protein n=1 Tax=Fusarium oxysporum NRRL 32931 TaxID=660029 RepID=W9H9F2_FUSOX|nr:hypothetical protein FOYG_17616 [Fusarium oxysporum NRRL 32931]